MGTTNSVVAYCDSDHRPEVLEPDQNHKGFPSTVIVTKDHGVRIGRHLSPQAGDIEISHFKRFIGRRENDGQLKLDIERCPHWELGNDGVPLCRVRDLEIRPIEVGAVLLRRAKQIAEKKHEEGPTECLVGVPANYSAAQRQATRDAGRLAGFKKTSLIQEPTAAAACYLWYYMIRHRTVKNLRKALVLDMGAGTLDVSLVGVLMSQGRLNLVVKLTSGNMDIGGNAATTTLADVFKKKIPEGEIKDDILFGLCEQAKIENRNPLSITTGTGKQYTVTRDEYREALEPLLLGVDKVINGLGNGKDDKSIDGVILVGGGFCQQIFSDHVKRLYGEKVLPELPSQASAVAMGAAIVANGLITFIDAMGHDLGLDVQAPHENDKDKMLPIIKKNQPLPAQGEITVIAMDPETPIIVCQGESNRASENTCIETFHIETEVNRAIKVLFRVSDEEDLGVTAIPTDPTRKGEFTILRYDIKLTDERYEVAAAAIQKLVALDPNARVSLQKLSGDDGKRKSEMPDRRELRSRRN